jgi:gamma-glutamylcyclotransferase (GGCT)/AIG2-like uncharacterized protein YtfP
VSRYIFLYGTLLPENAPGEIRLAVTKLRPYSRGSVRGTLFDFGEYPGAVIDDSSQKKIFGMVFRLPPSRGLLKELDRYEGFNPATPETSLFVRKLHPVELHNGRRIDCWVYEYNGKRGSAPVVTRGRYRKRDHDVN